MKRLMTMPGGEDGESLSTSDMNAVSKTTGYEKLQSVFSVLMTGGWWDAGVSFKDKDAGVEFLKCVAEVDPTLYGHEADPTCDPACPGCKAFKSSVDFLTFPRVMKHIEDHPILMEEAEELFSSCGFPGT